MKIVICDDNSSERNEISELIKRYTRTRSLNADIEIFSSSDTLLKESTDANIYILDIIMPEVDGIELGKRLRERNSSAAIIYLTNSEEFAINAFKVRAFSYILKPVEEKSLFSELDECISKLNSTKRKYYRAEIRQDDGIGIKMLPLDEIIAVEYSEHRLIYHLTEGNILKSSYKRGSFEDIAEYFHITNDFLKISASFIINVHNVVKLNSDSFTMADGNSYRITRGYSDVKKKYLDYILD